MTDWSRWPQVGLRDEPPLEANPGATPHFDRRAVSIRWLAATILMAGAAGALLVSALYAALGRDAQFAADPVVVVVPITHQSVAEDGRGDRIGPAARPAKGTGTPVRIEQLNNSGSAMQPFTHLFARLEELGQEALTADGDASSGAPPEPAASSSPAAGPLPPEILFGTSRARLPEGVSAYANVDEPIAAKPRPVLGKPLNVTVVPRSLDQAKPLRRVIVAKAGDTVQAILEALGAASGDAHAIAAAVPARRKWFGGDALAGGEVITVLEDTSGGDAPPHVFEVEVERPGMAPTAVAQTDDGRYETITSEDPDVQRSSPVKAPQASVDLRAAAALSLRDSLYALAQTNHLDGSLVDELVRLCSHDVDLETPVSPSDSVDVLAAPDRSGQPDLVFVAFTAGGQNRRYYRFTAPDDGTTDYYDADGRSITKFLLRKPVAAGRLGDGFGWRIHPILRDARFHEGVDYAAPYGSPIAAAGAGVVELISQQWGYGKYIRIAHDLGYETTYAHVAGFPLGLKVGDRVRQGETIAYIGSTGLSTGPHLYYEIRINGHNVDPLRVKLFDGRVLKGDVLENFAQARTRVDQLIDASSVATTEH